MFRRSMMHQHQQHDVYVKRTGWILYRNIPYSMQTCQQDYHIYQNSYDREVHRAMKCLFKKYAGYLLFYVDENDTVCKIHTDIWKKKNEQRNVRQSWWLSFFAGFGVIAHQTVCSTNTAQRRALQWMKYKKKKPRTPLMLYTKWGKKENYKLFRVHRIQNNTILHINLVENENNKKNRKTKQQSSQSLNISWFKYSHSRIRLLRMKK